MFYIYNPDEFKNLTDSKASFVLKVNNKKIINLLKKIRELPIGWSPAKNIICTYILIDEYTEEEVLELLTKIEIHNFSVFYLFGKKSDTNSVYLFRLANVVFRGSNHSTCLNELDNKLKEKTLSVNDFIENIHSSTTNEYHYSGWRGINYFLKEYERFLISKDYYYYTPLHNFKKFLIYNPVKSWGMGFNEISNERKIRLLFAYSLGNIVLSPKSRKNKNWKDLKIEISKNGSMSEKSISSISYDRNFIYSRGIEMLKFAKDRWKIDAINEDIGDNAETKKLLFNKPRLEVRKIQ